MATMQKLRAYHGPALFSYGFRPFFLFGAIYAGAMGPLWLAVFAGDVSLLQTFKGVVPFLIAEFFRVSLIIAFPAITLVLIR